MKNAYFYIDDTIWVLRDLTNQRPASLFDNAFMKMLKQNHEKYGLKVQLNLFYRTDSFYGYEDFTLAKMTDAYKEEFQLNKDWLRFAFHAMEEFPDYPHVNATYDDTKKLFKMTESEVERFAGENIFSYTVCPHWVVMSKEGVRALKDCGVELIDCSAGNEEDYNPDKHYLLHGHSIRIFNNRQPETKVMTYPGASYSNVCCYNHLSFDTDKEIHNKLKSYHNDEFDMEFKKFSCLNINATNLCDIPTRLSTLSGNEYIGLIIHEQYFYSDYFGYQPEFADKLDTTFRILFEDGYEFVTGKEVFENCL